MKAKKAFWPNRARALESHLDRSVAHPRVLEYLVEDKSLEGLPWVIACSGGPDSVALVLWSWAHFSGYRMQMQIAHFQHNTRGEESRKDQEFVAGLAEGLRLDFICGEAESWREKPSEEALRNARLAYFDSALPSRALLLTGHHQNDVLETQLMRLARGTSPAGLSAPRPVEETQDRRTILRPFINLPKERILEGLKASNAPYREDHSNQDEHYYRNRVRRDLVPLFCSVSPTDAQAGSRITRQWMEEDAEALAGWADKLSGEVEIRPGVLDTRKMLDLPVALWRRILMQWLTGQLGQNPFNHRGFEQMLQDVRNFSRNPEGALRISCGERETLVGSRGLLAIERETYVEPLQAGPLDPDIPRLLPLGYEIQFSECELAGREREALLRGEGNPDRDCLLDRRALNAAGYQSRLWVRSRVEGDAYRPLGGPGSRKLQDCFTDRKIPEKERNLRPIVCLHEGGEILWCPGLLPSETFKIRQDTESALRLTYRSTSTA